MTSPVIGAALKVEHLDTYRDWLCEKNRDLELQSFYSPEILIGAAWKDLADTAKAKLDGWNGRLGLHGPFPGLHLSNPDPDIRRIVEARMMACLDVCAALDAIQMVIHSPYTTWDHNNLTMNRGARERLVERAHDTLGAVVRRAEGLGVTLVIENIEDVDPFERKRLAQSFGSPNVKLSIDTGHAAYAHGSTGAPPVDYYVIAAGEMLDHVHLQDADGFADRHWAIGQGNVPWHAVFTALEQLETKPHLVLELNDAAGIPASMAWLESQGLGQ